MANEKVKTFLWLSFVVYLALAVGLEFYYRDPLFQHSLTWEKEWQAKGSKSLESFFRVLTQFGTQHVFIPLLIICVLFLPINKSYTYITVLIYSAYFDNLMKILYGNPRPFWVDTSLYKSCNGGFGNPSGHSFSSSSVFLAFWHLITDYPFFKQSATGIILRIFLLVLFILLIFTIMLTRLFLGVHSVNQVLYGFSLGVALYFIIFHLAELHKLKAEEFFYLFKKKLYIVVFSIWYAVLITVGVLVWKYKTNDTSQWSGPLSLNCPTLNEYRTFNNDGLFGILVLCCLIGSHYGIVFLVYLFEKGHPNRLDELNNWYKSKSFMCHVYRILVMVAFALPMILVVAISGTSSLAVIFVFKVSVPYLFTLFGFYGPAIFLIIKWKFGNQEIFNMSVSNSDIEKVE
jgi:membrane-associated phospholipid phosphatase